MDHHLLADEARRIGLDEEDWVVAGLAVVRAEPLPEPDLAADPITEAALRKAFEHMDGPPVAFQVQSCQLGSEAEASAALARLRKDPEASLPAPAQSSSVWLGANELMPIAASGLRALEQNRWCDRPLQEPALKGFFILRWTDRRPAAGFDKTLGPRRNALPEEL